MRTLMTRFKGRAFAKGHLIREEDIAELLKLGKEHVCVCKIQPGQVHENDAAMRIAGFVAGDSSSSGAQYGPGQNQRSFHQRL